MIAIIMNRDKEDTNGEQLKMSPITNNEVSILIFTFILYNIYTYLELKSSSRALSL